MQVKVTTHVVRTQFNVPEQAIKNNYLNKLVKFDPVSQKIILQHVYKQNNNKILGQFSQQRQAKAIYNSYVRAVKDLANYNMQKYGIDRNYKIDINNEELSKQLELLTVPNKKPPKIKAAYQAFTVGPGSAKDATDSQSHQMYGISKHNILQTINDLQYAIEHGLKQVEDVHEQKDKIAMDETVQRRDQSVFSLSKLPRGEITRLHDEALPDKIRAQRGVLIQNLKQRYTDQKRLRDSFFDLMDQVIFSKSNRMALAGSVTKEIAKTGVKYHKSLPENFNDIRTMLRPKLEKIAMDYFDSQVKSFSNYTQSLNLFANRSNKVLVSLYQSYKTDFAKAFADQLPDMFASPVIQKMIENYVQPVHTYKETGSMDAKEGVDVDLTKQAVVIAAEEIGQIADHTQKDSVDGRILMIDYNNYHAKPDDKDYGHTQRLFAPAKVLLNDATHANTPISLRREKFIPIDYQQEKARNQHVGIQTDTARQDNISFKSITNTPDEVIIFNSKEASRGDFVDHGVHFNQHTDDMKLVIPGAQLRGFAHDNTFNLHIKVTNSNDKSTDMTLLFSYDDLWPANQEAIKARVNLGLEKADAKSIALSDDQNTTDLTNYVDNVVLPGLERFAGTRKQLFTMFPSISTQK